MAQNQNAQRTPQTNPMTKWNPCEGCGQKYDLWEANHEQHPTEDPPRRSSCGNAHLGRAYAGPEKWASFFFFNADNDLARFTAQEGAFDANKHATRTVVTLLYRPVPADPPKTVTSDLRAPERLPQKAPP